MEEKIKCINPKCNSTKIKKTPYKVAAGAGSGGKLPGKTEHIRYECLECGKEFYEDDLKGGI